MVWEQGARKEGYASAYFAQVLPFAGSENCFAIVTCEFRDDDEISDVLTQEFRQKATNQIARLVEAATKPAEQKYGITTKTLLAFVKKGLLSVNVDVMNDPNCVKKTSSESDPDLVNIAKFRDNPSYRLEFVVEPVTAANKLNVVVHYPFPEPREFTVESAFGFSTMSLTEQAVRLLYLVRDEGAELEHPLEGLALVGLILDEEHSTVFLELSRLR
jgi:hypothetical protein